MAVLVTILGSLTALVCAVLLLRGYGRSRQRLLLWSALCFFGLALANSLLVVDLLQADVDLHVTRLGVSAVAMMLLLYGLVWETDGT
jgi:hypothetical protein